MATRTAEISKKSHWAYLILAGMMLLSAINVSAGLPLVRNFNRSTYGAGTQNWAIGQAPDGTMLFGNSFGLLSYDSHAWNLSTIDNNTTVRSLNIDKASSRIYVGASNDFGYFAPDSISGSLKYNSLRNTITVADTEFGEIWNIHRNNSVTWFQGDFKIFCYNGHKTSCINTGKKITTSALISGVLYIAFLDGTIGYVDSQQIKLLNGTELFNGDKVCAMLPWGTGSDFLAVTAFNGVFLCSGTQVTHFETGIDAFLRENQVFCASILRSGSSGDKIVFGTVNDGAVVKDLASGSVTFINKEAGLQNNTVLSAAFDNFGNLWLGLDNGIDFALINSPISDMLGRNNSLGAGYTSLLLDSLLYLGTNQGLYSTPFHDAGATIGQESLQQVLKGQVWHLDTIASTLFVSGDAGLFFKPPHRNLKKLDGVPGTWSVISLRSRPGYALASTYDSFYLLKQSPDGNWESRGKISGYHDAGGKPVEDSNGNIWIAHWIKGIYRLQSDEALTGFDHVDLFDSTKGLPTDNNNVLTVIDSSLRFNTAEGMYLYDMASGMMVPDTVFNSQHPGFEASKIFQAPNGELWSVSPLQVSVATPTASGAPAIDSVSFRLLCDKIIPGFENLNFISDDHLIVASQDGFYSVDTRHRSLKSSSNGVHITRIIANGDSLIFSDIVFPAFRGPNLKIPYKLNSLRIEFVSPEYRAADAVTYSCMLENYDDTWSPATGATSKEYTRLYEGEYTFRVRAHNAYTGTTEECSFTFTILPPWYRSLWAYIAYAILLIVAIYVSFMMFKRYSRRAAKAMEEKKEKELEAMKREAREETLQKDYEIARLKSEQLEHDIKHKSGELSNITMNVIRKNEILLDIAARLTKIQNSAGTTPEGKQIDRQLDKIKVLIRENISHDDDWRNFTRNFDIVYENYMKRLLDKYPSLSATDQRLCAYLKMGLSSKDIAPLLNISYRSVEMTRYRLRKKMGLSREVNLAEFLRNF